MTQEKPRILVVDDELSMRELLEVMLSREGYRIQSAENGRAAIALLKKSVFDILLCDIRLGDITGLDVLRAAKQQSHSTVVIMISAYATTETAVEAMNEGAYDFVPKPFDNEELKETIAKALRLKTLAREKESLDDELKKTVHFGKIVGNNPRMVHIYNLIRQVANTRTNILITGESGTGKELIARAIHDYSNRQESPFVAINCGGIPENLMESELFGHKRGAFTGATQDKKGLFEMAHQGTVFLDEIGELSLGQDRVLGYHLVNMAIHVLTAFVLFLTIAQMLRPPSRLQIRDVRRRQFVALLAAVLWAASPIQTQAVTYIVQRMAALATLFYILAIWMYVKGRNRRDGTRRIRYWIGAVVSFGLAMASKENAVMLPLSLVLIEMVCYQDLESDRVRRRFVLGSLLTLLLVLLAGVYLFMSGNFQRLTVGYEFRAFTPLERLLTQPRVVLFYISQIFYPVMERFSIEHPVVLSTTLFQPWTTLPALALVLGLIGVGCAQIRRRPLIALAILFFFVNHLIESTVMPLELIFEHRNYLPSLFLFLPLAYGVERLIRHYRRRSGVMFLLLVLFVSAVITGIGLGTYGRNHVWATEETLWSDATRKAPRNARPIQNLAYSYLTNDRKDHIRAIELYQRALKMVDINPVRSRRVSLSNLGIIHYEIKDFHQSYEYSLEMVEAYPRFKKARLRLVLSLLHLDEFEDALDYADQLLDCHFAAPGQHPAGGGGIYRRVEDFTDLEPSRAAEFGGRQGFPWTS